MGYTILCVCEFIVLSILFVCDHKERRKLHSAMVDYHKKQIALEAKVETLCHLLNK